MKPAVFVAAFAVFAAGGARAQLVGPAPEPAFKADQPALLRNLPSYSRFHGTIEGLAPADPQALDLYRADPKLTAGVDFNPYLGMEATFVNPNHREGLHLVAGDLGTFLGNGPRLAQGTPLGTGGYDVDLAARLRVPVDDRLGAFGKLGVGASERVHHTGTTTDVGAAASVGLTYKLNTTQTVTAEVPLGPLERKAMSGATDGYGARLKFGF